MKTISLTIQASLLLTLSLLIPHLLHAAAGDALRVTGANVNLRERPDIASPVILKVQRDTVVREQSRQGEWVSVEVPGNGSKGWIHATLLVRVMEKPVPAGEKSPALPVKGGAPSSTPVAAPKVSPQHEQAPMTTAAEPPKQPVVTKVGIVDLQRIIDESVEGKKTKKYFAEMAASTPAEDLKKIEQQLVRQVIERVERIIAQYARQEGFTHVIDAPKSGLVFTDERFDITIPIIRLYDQASADAAERPRVETPAGGETPRPAGDASR
jgi:hypothetical protein